jgi:hypothetical protein
MEMGFRDFPYQGRALCSKRKLDCEFPEGSISTNTAMNLALPDLALSWESGGCHFLWLIGQRGIFFTIQLYFGICS